MADPITVSPLDAAPELYSNQPQPNAPAEKPFNPAFPDSSGFDDGYQQALARDKGHAPPPVVRPPPPKPSPQATPPQQGRQQGQQTQKGDEKGDEKGDDNSSWQPASKRKQSQWKEAHEQWDKKEASYQARIAELEGKGGSNQSSTATAPTSVPDISTLDFQTLAKHPEVAKLKQAHDEAMEIVKQVAVERDPEFVAKFQPRRDSAINAAKRVAGGAANELAKLLNEPATEIRDERIAKLTENFSDASKRIVNAAMNTLATIDVERDAEIAYRKASFEARQLDSFKQSEQKQRERQQELDRAFDRQLASWADPKDGMPFFVKNGDPRWDAEVDATVSTARDIFNGNLTAEQLADYAKWAAVAKRVFNEREQLLSELQRFRDSDARWREGLPGDIGQGGSMVDKHRQENSTFDPMQPWSDTSFHQGFEEAKRRDMYGG